MSVPLSESARAAIEAASVRNPTLGEMPLFPAPRARAGDRPAPWTQYHARALLRRCDWLAGLLALDGSDFHAYRRKWAVERKDLPVQDVAAAGGWRDLRSLQNCYQQVDVATMLPVVTTPRKLREAK